MAKARALGREVVSDNRVAGRVYTSLANAHADTQYQQADEPRSEAAEGCHYGEDNKADNDDPFAAVLVRKACNGQSHGGVEQGE